MRKAQAAGAPIVELKRGDARNFTFVTAESVVLGSFSVLGGAFFILIGTTYGGKDDFQFRAYKPRNKVVLTTNKADDQGVAWAYSASLQDGKNALRKQTFRTAAGADSIVIPYPTADLTAFISAVTRAIDLRGLAHAAGGDDADDEDAGGTGGDAIGSEAVETEVGPEGGSTSTGSSRSSRACSCRSRPSWWRADVPALGQPERLPPVDPLL